MKSVVVIPSRIGSTRFPEKPLTSILSQPLLAWVIHGVKTSKKISECLVATDNVRIAKVAQDLGVEAIMTSSDLPSGTDRVCAALKGREADLVVNVQGDEPLVEGHLLDNLLMAFENDSKLEMATLGTDLQKEDLSNRNTVKVVRNIRDEAIYFSRHPIPYRETEENPNASLKHIGVYAYSRPFLESYCRQVPCDIEKLERLEQLRALYMGAKIKVLHVQYEGHCVDVPSDVQIVEKKLKEKLKKNG